jgi:hypothetical protein
MGIVMFKRLTICTGKTPACKAGTTVADVHKVGYCVTCPEPVLKSKWASRATS